jgi:hypothetical protein
MRTSDEVGDSFTINIKPDTKNLLLAATALTAASAWALTGK